MRLAARAGIGLLMCLLLAGRHASQARASEFEVDAVDPVTGYRFRVWTEGEDERYCQFSFDGARSYTTPARISYEIPLKAGTLIPGYREVPLPIGFRSAAASRLFIVQFHTIGIEAWRRQIRDLGAEVLQYLPHLAHIVRMSPGLVARIEALPFVRWVGPYQPGYRIEPALMDEAARATLSSGPLRMRLQVFRPGMEEKAALAGEIEQAGGGMVNLYPEGSFFEAMIPVESLAEVARSNHLLYFDRWTPPEEDMDIVRQVSGGVYLENQTGYLGQGVRAEVMDGGTDATHYDFDTLQWHGGSASAAHGTCTYGIVFGNGARDGDGLAVGMGMMPAIEVGYAAYYSSPSGGSRAAHTAELVQAPYNCVLQSNSWGSTLTRSYNSISAEMDQIIFDNDITILQSQSNAGNQDSRPQAWAKNIISVGGVYHYNNTSSSDDCWCGGASIGPAEDGRVKPDVAHFYDAQLTTDMLGTSGYDSGDYTCGGNSSQSSNCFGGTSGATPISAGIMGLIYQMWAGNAFGTNPSGTTVFEKRPHAMTAKALLINTAWQWPFSGTGSDLTRMHQGWGRPDLTNAYDRRNRIFVVDESSVMTEFQTDSYCLSVGPGESELKATLVYMDLPGTTSSTQHRINDVDLTLTDPDGVVYRGNVGLAASTQSSSGGVKDGKNTVENVFVKNPKAGPWTVAIYAADINGDAHTETPAVDQDYALLVSGVQPVAGPRVVVDGSILSGGCDNDAFLDRGESNASLQVTFRDIGCAAASGVKATLSVSSAPAGVTVSVSPTTAQDLGNIAVNATASFTWSVSMNDPGTSLCGSSVVLRADVTDASANTWTDYVTVLLDVDGFTPATYLDNVESGQVAEISQKDANWSIRGCRVTSGSSSWHMGDADCSGIPRDSGNHSLVYSIPLGADDVLKSTTFYHAFDAYSNSSNKDSISFEIDHDNNGAFDVIASWNDDSPFTTMQQAGPYDLSSYDATRANTVRFRFRFKSAANWVGPNGASGWDVDDFRVNYDAIACDADGCGGLPGEVSNTSLGEPALTVLKAVPDQVTVEKEANATAYNIYAGAIGTWYSPASTCHITSWTDNGNGTITLGFNVPSDSWIVVTASNSSGEGPAGKNSSGTERTTVGTWTLCGAM